MMELNAHHDGKVVNMTNIQIRMGDYNIPPAHRYATMVGDLFKNMETLEATRIHAALGISGEVAEILACLYRNDADSHINLIEESGDAFFYVQKLMSMHSVTLEDLLSYTFTSEMRMPTAILGMVYEAGNIVDVLKKSWVYGKALDENQLKHTLSKFLAYFRSFLAVNSLSFDDIKAANQWKLVSGPKARFPSGKYSNEAAIARADKDGEDSQANA